MPTTAIIFMLVTILLVSAITVYFFIQVLKTTKRHKQDSDLNQDKKVI